MSEYPYSVVCYIFVSVKLFCLEELSPEGFYDVI